MVTPTTSGTDPVVTDPVTGLVKVQVGDVGELVGHYIHATTPERKAHFRKELTEAILQIGDGARCYPMVVYPIVTSVVHTMFWSAIARDADSDADLLDVLANKHVARLVCDAIVWSWSRLGTRALNDRELSLLRHCMANYEMEQKDDGHKRGQ